MYIDGKWELDAHATFDVFNPASGEKITVDAASTMQHNSTAHKPPNSIQPVLRSITGE